MEFIPAPTPFPSLSLAPPWSWPAPSFSWPCHVEGERHALPKCRITMKDGVVHDAVLVDGRTEDSGLCLSLSYRGRVEDVAASELVQVDMVSPLVASEEAPGVMGRSLPMLAQACEYTVVRTDGWSPLHGTTLGHVQAAEGLFLFPPHADESSLLRVFIPRHVVVDFNRGPTARQTASTHWIRDADGLRRALHEGTRKLVIPMGQALIETAMLTPGQLDRVVQRATGGRALGETAVDMALVSAADVQTAIAYKMGRPFVDVASFPVDANALRLVPARVAIGCCALPLMLVDNELAIAVDKPVRAQTLERLGVDREHPIRVVLAKRDEILSALQVWYGDEFKRDSSLSKHFVATGF